MTQDVTQWLAEIKALQQQLTQVRQERDDAYVSAANWRKLYETEAQQRRTEAYLAEEKIAALEEQIQRFQAVSVTGSEGSSVHKISSQDLEQLQVAATLQPQLMHLLAERDHLLQALQAERTAHLQTRKSLTMALGDTVDLLTKERAKAQEDQDPT